jgi:hypothetical protein
VRIYQFNEKLDVKTEDGADQEVYNFTEGDLIIYHGTILNKLLRYRDFPVTYPLSQGILLSFLTDEERWNFTNGLNLEANLTKHDHLQDQRQIQMMGQEKESFHDRNHFDTISFNMEDDLSMDELQIRKSTFQHKGREHGLSNFLSFDKKESRRKNNNFEGGNPAFKSVEKQMENLTDKYYIELETLDAKKKAVTANINAILKRFGVNILFSTHAVTSSLLQICQNNNITVVFPLNDEEIKLLSKIFVCSIIDNEVLRKNKELEAGQFTASGFEYFRLENKRRENGEIKDHFLILKTVQSDSQTHESAGMLVYGEDEEQASLLTRFLRTNLNFIYFMNIDREVYRLERTLLDLVHSPIQSRQVGDLSDSLIGSCHQLKEILSFGTKLYMTKVSLVHMTEKNTYRDLEKEFKAMNDRFLEIVKQLGEPSRITAPREFDNFEGVVNFPDLYLLKNLNITKVDFIATMCESPVISDAEVYSSLDETLGIFLRNTFSLLNSPPETLNLPYDYQEKVTLYYINNACVRVTKDDYNGDLDIADMKSKLSNGKKVRSNMSFLRRMLLERYVQQLKKISENKKLEKKKSIWKTITMLRKDKESAKKNVLDKNVISCVIICQVCHKKISNSFELTKDYGNISLKLYLYALAQESRSEEIQGNPVSPMNLASSQVDEIQECQHANQARAFINGNKVIKFTRLPVEIFEIKTMDPSKPFEDQDVIFLSQRERNSQDRITEINHTYQKFVNYFMRQIALMAFICKDLMVKFLNDTSIGEEMSSKNFVSYKSLLKLYFTIVNLLVELDRLSDLTRESKKKTNLKTVYRIFIETLSSYNHAINQFCGSQMEDDSRQFGVTEALHLLLEMGREKSEVLENMFRVRDHRASIVDKNDKRRSNAAQIISKLFIVPKREERTETLIRRESKKKKNDKPVVTSDDEKKSIGKRDIKPSGRKNRESAVIHLERICPQAGVQAAVPIKEYPLLNITSFGAFKEEETQDCHFFTEWKGVLPKQDRTGAIIEWVTFVSSRNSSTTPCWSPRSSPRRSRASSTKS